MKTVTRLNPALSMRNSEHFADDDYNHEDDEETPFVHDSDYDEASYDEDTSYGDEPVYHNGDYDDNNPNE